VGFCPPIATMSGTPKLKTAVVGLSLLALLAPPAAAQEDSAAVFRSDSRLVVLHATVLDQEGRRIINLPKGAFRVYENGVEQDLKVFRREDSPVSIGLIIDDSGSMSNKREKVAAAALAMVRASHPDDEVFVMHFNEKSYLDLDFTSDPERLRQGLNTFDSRGTTAMREAVRLAIAHMDHKAREDKKVLLIVTDGEDNTSQVSRDQVVKLAQQSGVLVYSIGILNEIGDAQTELARRELDALTQATGGQAYYLDSVAGADTTARDIARDIRNQYTLAYTPVNQDLDGTYRRIQVTASQNTEQLTVRTRSGYYASGPAAAKAKPPANP
jgi:Ca-activated chloride channel homolog